MNGIDIFLQKAIVAAFFWVIVAQYMQQKWHIIDAYFGKKYARSIVRALFILVWLQVGIVGMLSLRSTWDTHPSVVFGTLVLACAIYMLFRRRQTPFAIYRTQSFKVYVRQHIPFVLIFLGLGYATGGLGLLLGAFTYLFCAVVHAAILGRFAKTKR